MKKYFKLLSLVLILSLVTSCNKNDELLVFDSVNGQTLIKLKKSSAIMPTPNEGITSIEIEVFVSTASSSDREIMLTFDETSTATADQYTMEGLTIPAGAFVGVIKVTSHYDAIPEEGSVFLKFSIASIGGSRLIENGTLSIELFRKCPIVSGDYILRMVDVYGDGWQGSHITVTIDGVATDYSLPSWWDRAPGTPYGPAYYDDQAIVNVPEGTETLTFSYTAGDYPTETFYEIFSPNDILIFTDGDSDNYNVVPAEGDISFNPCNS